MPLKIIYLDDELDLLEMFVDIFAGPDYEIQTFTTVEPTLAAIKQSRPDLLILDYRLINTNGDLVAQSVDPDIPKIMITGEVQIKPVAHFLRIFHKPYDPEDMREFLRYLLPFAEASRLKGPGTP